MFARCRWFGLLVLAVSAASVMAADWPQWRGPNRDDVSKEEGLQAEWAADGPSKLWLSDKTGLGYSGFAVVGDTLYTMGADDANDSVIAVSVADGSVKWTASIGERLENRWGDGPRCTPTIDGERLYALAGRGT